MGDTIRRPVRIWTPVVHSLLRYLEGVPRALGVDREGFWKKADG